MDIEFKILDARIEENQWMPHYEHPGDAGLDIHACNRLQVTVPPLQGQVIPTGFALHISDPNVVALLLPRSGKGIKEGLVLSNSVGVIDSTYQNEVMVGVWNRNPNHSITINPGDEICQLLFVPVLQAKLNKVTSFSHDSVRHGGLGHTGG